MAKHYTFLIAAVLFVFALALTGTEASALVGSRIKARVSLQGNGTGGASGDSTVFQYPANNTSLFNEGSFYAVGSGAPSFAGKDVYIHDGQGLTTFIYRLNWVAATSSFDTSFRFTYTFNAAGDQISALTETKNTGAGYSPSSRVAYTYNAAHQETKRTSERWRSTGSIWDTTIQYVHDYNAQGKETKFVKRSWSTTTHSVNFADSILSEYNSSGLAVLKDSAYTWVTASATYRPNYRTFYTINSSNLVVSGIQEGWNVASGTYKNSSRTTNTFDASNRLAQATTDSWNATTSSWMPNTRATFTYSATGELLVNLYELWSTATSSYAPTDRQTNTYNSYGQQTVFLVEVYNNGAWQLNYATFSYFELYNELGILQPASTAQALWLKLAPNPASGAMAVRMQWDVPQDFVVTVTDMAGRVLQHIPGHAAKESNTAIDVNELPAGNYILSVSGSAGGRSSSMFAVRH